MKTSSVEPYPQLLSLAVHEFRTPASVVGGYLRMLQQDVDSPLSERQRKMVDEAAKSCSRLVALIAELSDIGKLDAGQLSLARQEIDLFGLVGEVAEHMHEGRDRDVHLAVCGDPTGAPVTGDGTRLRSAFEALFRGVLRDKSGPCTVAADRRSDRIDGRRWGVVVFADDERVREAYEAPHGPFDDMRGGMGLALQLARRVIEGHGGRLWSPAADKALARGSVIVALPLAE